jgi:DNA-directed RNA polymerase specialized sigma24 family protein
MLPVILSVSGERINLISEFGKAAISYIDGLYNFGLRMTGSRVEANKLLIETYRRAFNFFDKLSRETDIKTWLFRIMIKSFYDFSEIKADQAKTNFEETKFYRTGKKDY